MGGNDEVDLLDQLRTVEELIRQEEEEEAAAESSHSSQSRERLFEELSDLVDLREALREALGLARDLVDNGVHGDDDKARGEDDVVEPDNNKPGGTQSTVYALAVPPHMVVSDPDPPLEFSFLAREFPPLEPFLRVSKGAKESAMRKRQKVDVQSVVPAAAADRVGGSGDGGNARGGGGGGCGAGCGVVGLGSRSCAQPARGEWTLDFSDSAAVRTLNFAILSVKFGLSLTLPATALCPTATLRANYVRWLQHLLRFISADRCCGARCPCVKESECGVGRCGRVEAGPERPVRSCCARGVDVGTGSSCVYPLLGCSMNSGAQGCGWMIVGSDIDEHSLACARDNVRQNKLESRIDLVHNPDPKNLLAGVLPELRTREEPGQALGLNLAYDFCMCNPPFFESDQETHRNRKSSLHSNSKRSELVFDEEGGEVAFITKMVAESEHIRRGIVWYTTMLGKKASLAPLKRLLNEAEGVTYVRTAEFAQGRTSRWGLAWTYCPSLGELRKQPPEVDESSSSHAQASV